MEILYLCMSALMSQRMAMEMPTSKAGLGTPWRPCEAARQEEEELAPTLQLPLPIKINGAQKEGEAKS